MKGKKKEKKRVGENETELLFVATEMFSGMDTKFVSVVYIYK